MQKKTVRVGLLQESVRVAVDRVNENTVMK